MPAETLQSFLDKLSLDEKRQAGETLLGKGLVELIIFSPAGNIRDIVNYIRPVLIEINEYLDEDPGSRELFLEGLRNKTNSLPNLEVDFGEYIYELCEADWAGHEDSEAKMKKVKNK